VNVAAGAGAAGLQAAPEALLALTDAAGKLRDAFGQIGLQLASFVSAFSPATVVAFQQAMRNLTATLGKMFAGPLAIFTDLIQQVTAALDPLMDELAPLLTDLAQTIAGALLPLFKVMAAVLTPMIPVLKSIFEALGKVFQELVRYIVLAIGQLSKTFGSGALLDDMIASLKAAPKKVENAAPTGAAIKGFQQITADLATAAFAASGKVQGRTNEEFQAEMLKQLEKIAEGKETLGTIIL
jgi:hypothetical protein